MTEKMLEAQLIAIVPSSLPYTMKIYTPCNIVETGHMVYVPPT